MKKHQMLQEGDRVVVGVSGGADSVCLLFLLLEWQKEHLLDIAVVHVNHGIRAEAGEDAHYVEQLCAEKHLPFFLTQADVRDRARREKISEEEAGRRTRYEAFAKAAKEWGAGKIAVAHNSNDRSETQLFHLFRGSGIRGLASILPVRDEIIRPILCLERAEIEDFLRQREISYCRDATNDEDDYTRNRIRHHILPYAEENIAKGCVAHMNQTAELMAETEEYLELQTQEAVKKCVRYGGMVGKREEGFPTITARQFLALHPVIRKRLLYEEVKRLSPGQKDITYKHIQELLTLFTQDGNRTICLPFGIRGRREYDKVVLSVEKGAGTERFPQTLMLQTASGSTGSIVCESGILQYCVRERADAAADTMADTAPDSVAQVSEKNQEVPTNQYTKWFDYDKIKKCPMVRTRQTGDYLTIADGKGGRIHKSLKSFLVDQKIPCTERDRLPLLAEDDHILWVVGYRISEYYKVTENTKRILEVQFIRKEFA